MSFNVQLTARQTILVSCGDESFELPLKMLSVVLQRTTQGKLASPPGPVESPPASPPTLAPGTIVRPPKPRRPAVIGVVAGRGHDGDEDIQMILEHIVPATPIRLTELYGLGEHGIAAVEARTRKELGLSADQQVILDAILDHDPGRPFAIGPMKTLVDSGSNGIGAIRLIVDED